MSSLRQLSVERQRNNSRPVPLPLAYLTPADQLASGTVSNILTAMWKTQKAPASSPGLLHQPGHRLCTPAAAIQ